MKRLIHDVPRWHLLLHREARGMKRASMDDEAALQFQDELFDRLYSGKGQRLADGQQHLQFGRWAESLHATCEGLPSFQRLANECRGDVGATATAVETLLDELGSELRVPSQKPEARPTRRAIAQSCKRASEAVETYREATSALEQVSFSGDAAGDGHTETPPSDGAKYRALASRLRGDERLKRIALLAGKFKRIMAAKRRTSVHHAADEVADVEQGAELARILPADLARLTRQSLRLAFFRDFTERRCLQYRLSGTETLGRGPLVLCLDKSGSMDGPKDIWATAVALALLEHAHAERRPFGLICFNGNVTYKQVVPVGQALPDAALFVACDGGTDIELALGTALDVIGGHSPALRKADVVLVTDGASPTIRASWIRTRASTLQASILGIGIETDRRALAPWCDDVRAIESFDTLDEALSGSLAGL